MRGKSASTSMQLLLPLCLVAFCLGSSVSTALSESTSPAAVTLIIDSSNRADLLRALNSVSALRRRAVAVEKVVIIGTILPADLRESRALLRDGQITDAASVVLKFGLKNSPAWVVSVEGKEYIFEGLVDPLRLFSAAGDFVGGSTGFGVTPGEDSGGRTIRKATGTQFGKPGTIPFATEYLMSGPELSLERQQRNR